MYKSALVFNENLFLTVRYNSLCLCRPAWKLYAVTFCTAETEQEPTNRVFGYRNPLTEHLSWHRIILYDIIKTASSMRPIQFQTLWTCFPVFLSSQIMLNKNKTLNWIKYWIKNVYWLSILMTTCLTVWVITLNTIPTSSVMHPKYNINVSYLVFIHTRPNIKKSGRPVCED